MLFSDIFKISWLNAVRSKTRTVLTALSITIGVASVIIVTSVGNSAAKMVSAELDKMGLRGISIFQNPMAETEPLKAEDAESIIQRFDEVKTALPVVMEYGAFRLNNTASAAVILGVGENADDVYKISLLHGRIPNVSDVRGARRVAVIDDELAHKSYRRENVVGKEIVVNLKDSTEKFTIIGVIKSQKDGINQLVGGALPDFVYMPYTTVNELRETDEISQIAVKCLNEDVQGAEIAQYLSRKSGTKDGYVFENLASRIGEIQSVTGLISLLISAIAAISLCVAGLGIMNTMFSSTKERHKEIGICMAVGATSRDISMCFLAESVIIALIGGTLGAAIGFGLSLSVTKLLNMQSVFSIMTFVNSELISIFCGALFSVIPAIRASKLDPIITLRAE